MFVSILSRTAAVVCCWASIVPYAFVCDHMDHDLLICPARLVIHAILGHIAVDLLAVLLFFFLDMI